jgi:hypothetical protein
MASLRNLVITILRLAGAASIAARPALSRPAAHPSTADDPDVLTALPGPWAGPAAPSATGQQHLAVLVDDCLGGRISC